MFDANKVKDELIKWIRQFFQDNGSDCNAVVGISGGKDSSIVAALCKEALGKDRILGILMPNGRQIDLDSAELLVKHLDIKYQIINIKDSYDALIAQFAFKPSRQTLINLAPRLRMAVLYAIGQTFNGRVANTCNLSEDWVGYSTRYGDTAGDFSPLSHLTVTEVKEIGRLLDLPSELIDKVPSDGLTGKSDEEVLGFTYAELDKYIRTGKILDADKKKRIDELHKNNLFKLKPMPYYDPGIEVYDESL